MRLQNKTIKVSFARPSSDSIKGANLYVCGLHKDFNQSDLEKMFNQFGTIISSKILTDPKTGKSLIFLSEKFNLIIHLYLCKYLFVLRFVYYFFLT